MNFAAPAADIRNNNILQDGRLAVAALARHSVFILDCSAISTNGSMDLEDSKRARQIAALSL